MPSCKFCQYRKVCIQRCDEVVFIRPRPHHELDTLDGRMQKARLFARDLNTPPNQELAKPGVSEVVSVQIIASLGGY